MSKTINYNGTGITVRAGAWLDVMNSCFYEVIDTIDGYRICRECGNGAVFALESAR